MIYIKLPDGKEYTVAVSEKRISFRSSSDNFFIDRETGNRYKSIIYYPTEA